MPLQAVPYNAAQIEVGGAVDTGMDQSDVTWGDVDSDGDVDIVACGQTDTGPANNARLRIYRYDGGTAFTAFDVDGANGGLRNCAVSLGDFDNDGDLDLLASGMSSGGGANPQLRVYIGLGSTLPAAPPYFSVAQTEVEGVANQGLYQGDVDWGDFDKDGDLDILATGTDAAGNPQFRVYKNNGNGTVDFTQIDINTLNNGLDLGGAAFGDYDGDGDLDVMGSGLNGANNPQVRLWKNNGDGSFNTNEVDVAGLNAGLSGGDAAFGDCDSDGDMDIAVHGMDGAGGGGARQIRVYRNDGGDVFTLVAVEGTANQRLTSGGIQWGDTDNDGDMDILVSGQDSTAAPNAQLRIYRNNGACGGFDAGQFEVDGNAADLGLYLGDVSWRDFNADGKMDVLAAGNDSSGGDNSQLRVYLNTTAQANTAPNAPAVLASTFAFSTVGRSTGAFQWQSATDNAPGATPQAALRYEVRVSTNAGFSPAVGVGSGIEFYPLSGGFRYVQLTSTHPWNLQSGTSYGLRTDTTYYFQVRSYDAILAASPWSATQTLWTGVAPASSTISVGSGLGAQATMTWTSAGSDLTQGSLTGNYRVQYSTDASTAWSETSTPAGAFTFTAATAAVTPGSLQTLTFTGLTEGATTYFVLWTQDAVGLWSPVSPVASLVVPTAFRSVTITETEYPFGNVPLGSSTGTVTAVNVTYSGTINGSFSLAAATMTAGSPWSLSSSPSDDAAAVYAAFHPVQPALAAFGVEDVVLNLPQSCGATAYTVDGSQACQNMVPGAAQTLWLRLDAPLTSTTEIEQQIQITIDANPP